MSEIIAETDIPREKGYLYVTGTNSNGCLTIIRVVAGRKKKEVKQ